MTLEIAVGQKFGALTVLRIVRNQRTRRAYCRCDCGREHDAEARRVYHGLTTRCQFCASPKQYDEKEYRFRQQFHNYRNGAARRGYDYLLDIDQFRKLHDGACVYCGTAPSKGVDRRDNAVGYLVANCASCCKHCNLAKRDMSEGEFFAWIVRVAEHQGFSL